MVKKLVWWNEKDGVIRTIHIFSPDFLKRLKKNQQPKIDG